MGQKLYSVLNDIVSNEVHSVASIYKIFNGSFGSERRLVQKVRKRSCRLDSWIILLGSQTKLFHSRYNFNKDDKQPKAPGIA